MSKLLEFKQRNKTSLWAGISLMGALCFMLFFYAPLELFFYNQREFWFDVYTLFPLVIVLFLVSFAVLSAVMFFFFVVFPKFYLKGVLPISCIVFLCTYIQGNFLVGNLPPMDGTEYDWADYSEGRIYSIILWIVVSIIVVVAWKLVRKKLLCSIVRYGSIGMVLMLTLTIVSIFISTEGYAKKLDAIATYKNDYEFSENKNFIILLLDATDSQTLYEMMEETPEYRDIFTDFTYYRNTLGAYPCTMCAVPHILSGEWFENETSFDDYCTDVYKNSAFLASLEAQGYKLGMYENELPYSDESIFRFDNVLARKSKVSSYLDLARLEIKLVGLRYMPFDLKKFCSFKIVEFRSTMKNNDEYEVFVPANDVFYKKISESEPSYTQENCFKFIHLAGAHVPFQYDKDVNVIEGGTYEGVIGASMTITKAYLEKLKEVGVYDNSVIIVMADHGLDGSNPEAYTGRQNPILFVKGINETHDEMVLSEAPISYVDLQEAFARLLDGKSSGEIFDYQEGDVRERRYLYYIYEQDEHMYEQVTEGHASEDAGMEATGKEYIR